jgi:hypothetical protein
MHTRFKLLSLAAVASMTLGGAASAATMSDPAITTPGTHASVIAMNQKLKGDAVSITYAYLPSDGSLSIFSGDPAGSQNAKPIGQVSLKAGDHRDVNVQLSDSPKEGTKLWAVLEKAKSGQAFKDFDKPAEQTFKAL